VSAHRNFSRERQGLEDMASAERVPITGGLGLEPPVGSRARAPDQGGKAPEAESFEEFAHLKKAHKFAVTMPRPSKYGTGSYQRTQLSSVSQH